MTVRCCRRSSTSRGLARPLEADLGLTAMAQVAEQGAGGWRSVLSGWPNGSRFESRASTSTIRGFTFLREVVGR